MRIILIWYTKAAYYLLPICVGMLYKMSILKAKIILTSELFRFGLGNYDPFEMVLVYQYDGVNKF